MNKRCKRCSLCESRSKVVVGKGNIKSKILIVGEAPGKDEDREGIPFVGEAGKVLDKMLAFMNLTLDSTPIFFASLFNLFSYSSVPYPRKKMKTLLGCSSNTCGIALIIL